MTRAEADLYHRTTEFLRRLYREGFIQPAEQEEAEDEPRRRRPTKKGILQLAVIHLRQRLCSSARALAESLAHLAEGERISPEYRNIAKQLAKRAEGIKTHAKLDVLTKLLRETPDRVVVFSDHRPTIQLIEQRVKKLGRQPVVYWGAHSTTERDKRIRAFHEDETSVLIATRAGSEGRNLQFCNVLVNYDLPWNPMVVEQRIGRLHRIGQTREVHIVNLAAAGTIESYILQLLVSMSAPRTSTRRAKSSSLSAASHCSASRPSNCCAPPNSPRIRSSSPTTSSNSLIFRSSSWRM